jgi:hypothetical protein
MPSRRSALVMFGSLVAGAAGLTTTGAFSTVEASRTATVETAGDADALLGIEPYDKSQNLVNTNGTVEIDIQNVNKNAITAVDQLLEVTNNGTEKVTVGFVAEYAKERGDFDADSGEVRPYGYTYATNETDDVALVLWASPKQSRMDNTYAQVRPELVTTGFEGSTLVDGGSSRDEIIDTVGGGGDENGRQIGPGESVNVGLVIDTRDETIDQNGGIPDALNKNISLLAERTANIESE